MLYIDQPILSGYSYTKAKNGTFDLITGTFTPFTGSVSTNLTTVLATRSSDSLADTVNTTAQAARLVYKFAQIWFQE
jgi:carboxypeptidase D